MRGEKRELPQSIPCKSFGITHIDSGENNVPPPQHKIPIESTGLRTHGQFRHDGFFLTWCLNHKIFHTRTCSLFDEPSKARTTPFMVKNLANFKHFKACDHASVLECVTLRRHELCIASTSVVLGKQIKFRCIFDLNRLKIIARRIASKTVSNQDFDKTTLRICKDIGSFSKMTFQISKKLKIYKSPPNIANQSNAKHTLWSIIQFISKTEYSL